MRSARRGERGRGGRGHEGARERSPLFTESSNVDRKSRVLTARSQTGRRETGPVRITAKADYAVRAAAELAAAQPDGVPVKGEQLAQSQDIPQNFLENILTELRRAGHRALAPRRRRRLPARAARGRDQRGRRAAGRRRPARRGPGRAAPGSRPTKARPSTCPRSGSRCGPACAAVLEHVTLADLASGRLPKAVTAKTADPDAWQPHARMPLSTVTRACLALE